MKNITFRIMFIVGTLMILLSATTLSVSKIITEPTKPKYVVVRQYDRIYQDAEVKMSKDITTWYKAGYIIDQQIVQGQNRSFITIIYVKY